MFLSSLQLNESYRPVQQALSNAYEMHRTLMGAFGQAISAQARDEFQMMYRLLERKNCLNLLVMHYATADWGRLEQSGFRLSPVEHNPKPLDAMLENLKHGRYYRFDLLCAPSKKVKVAGKKNSQRRFLIGESKQLQWFSKKALEGGFLILPDSLKQQEQKTIRFKKPNLKNSYQSAVRWEGILRVENEALFRKAYQSGFGSGKSFGLGMMLLLPL